MRLQFGIAFFILLTGLLLDWYVVTVLKRTNHRRCLKIYAVVAAILTLEYITGLVLPRNAGSNNVLLAVMWMLFTYFTFYLARLLFFIISLLGRIPCLFRRRPVHAFNIVGGVASLALFATMWWGAVINRFSLEVEHVDLYYSDLPPAFDGLRIVQFSDFHVGTYRQSTRYVAEIVDSINALSPDLILFTGDIVNRRTDEILPFVATLSRLSAPMGVYSVLGNHDYGDYSKWPSPEAKSSNLTQLLDEQTRMGWTLLNNDHTTLYLGGDSIRLVGVENWGEPPFTTYGDLNKAYPSPSDSTFKILLTHNPMHWVSEVEPDESCRYHLTLSGHTHAMQIEVGHWSPAKWRYPIYDGLYSAPDSIRKIYVSRGIGTVGMPARIGATPAITLITLHRKS